MRISDWSSDVCSSDLLRARKTDLLIGLSDGRAVAVEAKDSDSVLNSVKRVLNDTAAKARYWDSQCGKTVVTVALRSGAFGVDNLKSRSEGRRVGKECVSRVKVRGSP